VLMQTWALSDIGCRPPQAAEAKVRARAAVMNLVIRKAAPPHLWVPLLFAAIPVMEASPPAFSTADTEQLLLAIQACHPSNIASAQYPIRRLHSYVKIRGRASCIKHSWSLGRQRHGVDGMLSRASVY